jgi:hypothetical protein
MSSNAWNNRSFVVLDSVILAPFFLPVFFLFRCNAHKFCSVRPIDLRFHIQNKPDMEKTNRIYRRSSFVLS